jgi:hypothetical protein
VSGAGVARGAESWLLDYASDDTGIAGFVRLELRPDEQVARYWSYLVAPAFDGVVVVRDDEVSLPRSRLEIRAEGLWAELVCETPHEHWTFGLEAFGVRLDDPDDARRGEIGERLAVGLDLEWEVGDLVHGEVLVERERWTFDGRGTFAHVTGETDWAAQVTAAAGDVGARAVVPLGEDRYLERSLCRTAEGLRWATTAVDPA